ncbi:MAG: hypothetical protein ACI9NN_001730 [Bacteroidia bacterium]|jgi:hypothetical protein
MKKVAFVSLVLVCSLMLLQFFLWKTASKTDVTHQEKTSEPVVIQPVSNHVFFSGDYIIQVRDGKYYVYKRNLPST